LEKEQTKLVQTGTRERKKKEHTWSGRAFNLIVVFVEEEMYGWRSACDGYSELGTFNASAPMTSCQGCSC
jgi:hypothetical protein